MEVLLTSSTIEKMKYSFRSLFRRFGFDIVRLENAKDPFVALQLLSRNNSIGMIFDVGAHIGQTTNELSLHFPEAEIYSFEPYSIVYSELQKRFRASTKIKTFNLALGASNGNERLFINSDSLTNSLLPGATDHSVFVSAKLREKIASISSSTIRVSRLDTFCHERLINHIDLLKIDVQGYEDFVLKGAKNMLDPAHIRFIFLEVNFVPLYKNQVEFDKIYCSLTKKGYKFFDFFNEFTKPNQGILWADALFISP
jgi:FkbM family methyltransferase